MATAHTPSSGLLRELAELTVAMSGESVSMVKRSAPEQALKLKKRREWDIFLEFFKVIYHFADRLSAFYVPIQEQPQFMDGLRQAVVRQLQSMLAPALGPDSDEMEITHTIGKAVAESHERYEHVRFVVTDESPAKEELLKSLGARVAELLDARGNGMVISAATLCASSAIAAMQALFEGVTPQGAPGTAEASVASPGGELRNSQRSPGGPTGSEIKLVSVMSTVKGEEVETRWGLHPKFRQDLTPEQAQELTRLMNRVTQILGQRYAAVAFSADWVSWHRIGHA